MGISLTQAARLAAVFQVEGLEIQESVETTEEGGEGALATPEGHFRRVFDLARVKSLSLEDRKVCYEALVLLRETKNSSDFVAEKEPENKLTDNRIEEITRQLFASVKEKKELTKPLEIVAAKLSSLWKGFLNILRLRHGTEKLGKEIEEYRSGAMLGKIRYHALTGKKENLIVVETKPGLIQEAIQKTKEKETARLSVYKDQFTERNQQVAYLQKLEEVDQIKRDLKTKFVSPSDHNEFPVNSFSQNVLYAFKDFIEDKNEDVLREFEPLLQKAATMGDEGELVAKEFARDEEGEIILDAEGNPQPINQEEIRQEFEKLKALFKVEEEEAFKKATDELNQAAQESESLINEKALLKAKYHKFKPADKPEIVEKPIEKRKRVPGKIEINGEFFDPNLLIPKPLSLESSSSSSSFSSSSSSSTSSSSSSEV